MSSLRDIKADCRPPIVPAVPLGDFYLLAIGIDGYERCPALQTAVHGAREVAQALVEQYGFSQERVFSLFDRDATRKAIIRQLRELAQRLSADDSLLIYYAGHGHLDSLTQVGSWMPVDADLSDADGWISNSDIKNILRAAKARHILLVSDSCFSGDFFRRASPAQAEITDEYVRLAFAKSSRQVLTSGGLEPVLDGGAEGHSVFTWFLLRQLRESREPYLLPLDLFQRIKGGVAANARQQPQLGILLEAGGEVGGEFVLFRGGGEGGMEEMLRHKRERITELERREQEARQAAAAQQAVLEAKAEELRQLDERIRELSARLKQPGAGGNELDELVEMVEAKERQAAELARLRKEAEVARRQREEELRRLRQEEEVRRSKEFEADRAKYAKICGSAYATAEVKAKAWEAICRNWQVEPKGRGDLVWKDGGVRLMLGPRFDREWTNSLGMKFVPVSGTTVLFSIWETRVRDYEAFVKATKRDWEKAGFEQGPTHPAVNVSWDDAKAFCQWLSEKERAEDRLASQQAYRLPTDAEWSFAVDLNEPAGGTPREKDGKIQGVYPWGTQWPPPKGAGNYSPGLQVDDYDYTSPVGSFAANRYGLYDLGGNVWEWCEDFFDGKGGARVLRGASWYGGIPGGLLSSYRGLSPVVRIDYVGFRVVLAGGVSVQAGNP